MRKYCVSAVWFALSVSACSAGFVAAVADSGPDAESPGSDATIVDAAQDAAADRPNADRPPIDAPSDRADTGLNCPANQIECGGRCQSCVVDPGLSDSQNRVAACGTDGGCSTTCKPNATLCGSGESAVCANLDNDPATCGACNLRCGLGKGSGILGLCNAGKCVPQAIAEPSVTETALTISSSGVMLFHKANQVHSCTLPACANANALSTSTAYTAPPSPNSIATAGAPPLVFFTASETTDAGTTAYLARCNINGCATPAKHASRGAIGLVGDGNGLFLADSTGLLQQVDIGSTGAVSTIATMSGAVSLPVLSPTHIYFFNSGSGIYRCPRSGACTPEKLVSTSGTVNAPYDVVNDTLFYAENSTTPGASRVLSCSVATTPAACDSSKVKVLASGLPTVASVAADTKAVYFTNKGVSVCTDLIQGCTGTVQLNGFVPADADHAGVVRVSGEFIYWVQAYADTAKSVKIMRVHVPY